MLEVIQSMRWQDVCDILIVSYIIYRLILIIRGTRAVQMLTGIAILIVTYFGARELEFLTLYWLLGTFLSSIFLVIIIVFQRDIRRALTQVGQQTPFARTQEDEVLALDEVVEAAYTLSSRKIGALIVIERETGLKDYLESGHTVDAQLSKEILISFFHPESPLHDGGVVIRKGRIMSAGCVLPLSKNPYIQKRLGTRHRAAIGLSEETDAVIIVVSEETRQVSLVQHGAITTDLDQTALRNRLDAIFVPKEFHTQLLWKNWLNRS
ncbi:MAG: diadenylate cyclase CdaA [Desulfobacteraceae bacterium]|nr:diadenylate cyclase CdaA [Desulfobacteraceae bacterium]